MEYNFNDYVAVHAEMDVLAENKEAMALIKTFDGTAKNSRGAFIAKAVSDLGMNATTAGAYWQRNKKYAISQGAAAVMTPPVHKPARSTKASNVDVASAVTASVADWGRVGQKALPQNGVTMGPLVIETGTTTTKATGTFYGIKNGTTGNYTGWIIFPTEGYASKIIDNTRPVAPSMPVDKNLNDGLRESIMRIGKAVGMTSSSMMGVIKAAHDEYKRNQEAGFNGSTDLVARDAWSKSLLQTYRDWVSSGQKVLKMEGRYLESQGDGYMSMDGGGYQGRPYKFGAYNSGTYRLLGVVLFPKEGYAYYTDKDGKRCQPAIVTKEFAKELITKVRNLGEVLDISPDSMISSINATANRIEAESIAAKGAIGDVKKYCAMADSIIKDLLELEKLASVINPHVKNDALSRVVSYQSSEMRKNLTATKQWANDLK
ncbi:hypothetical protein AHP1_2001 [Aeromonas phage Ahp1_CNU-2021]|nr:hypothetical protein AHP1_2001 [Aeromonas phage Ahp1_CNU-2021]